MHKIPVQSQKPVQIKAPVVNPLQTREEKMKRIEKWQIELCEQNLKNFNHLLKDASKVDLIQKDLLEILNDYATALEAYADYDAYTGISTSPAQIAKFVLENIVKVRQQDFRLKLLQDYIAVVKKLIKVQS